MPEEVSQKMTDLLRKREEEGHQIFLVQAKENGDQKMTDFALEKGGKIFLHIFLSRRRIKLTYYNMLKKVQEIKLSVIIEMLFKILGSDLVQGSPVPNLTLKQP